MHRLEQEPSVRNRTGEEIANGALEPLWDSMLAPLLLPLHEAENRLPNFLEAERDDR